MIRGAVGAAVVLATALTAAPSASAAVCNLVTDARGDQTLVSGLPIVPVPGGDLDILSADVAVDATHVVGAVRLASLQRVDPLAPGGRQYEVTFTNGGVEYTLTGTVALNSSSASGSSTGGSAFPATMFVDDTRAEVRIQVKIRDIRPKGPAWSRGVLTGISAHTRWYAGIGGGQMGAASASGSWGALGTGFVADEASTGRTYRIGTPTCVPMPG